MARNSGQTQRHLLESHGAGKGDADRSPGWREQYDTVAWPHDDAGFERVGTHKQVKRYGQREPVKHEHVHGKVIIK